jgi:hypothetical protein
MNVEDLLQYFENRMNFPSKFCGAWQLALFFPHFYIILFCRSVVVRWRCRF